MKIKKAASGILRQDSEKKLRLRKAADDVNSSAVKMTDTRSRKAPATLNVARSLTGLNQLKHQATEENIDRN